MKELPCLPLIQERFWNDVKDREEYTKNRYPDLNFRMFEQTWADTSLGFGGIGGQAITTAYTTVVTDNCTGWCGVFFGERLAYTILNPNECFFSDIASENMASCRSKGKYLR